MRSPLHARIAALRGRVRRLLALHGLSLVLAGFALFVLAVGLADYFVHLVGPVRVALLIGLAGMVAYLTIRHVVAPLVVRFRDLDIAMKIERRWPGLNDRLASTVQFLEVGEVERKEDQSDTFGSRAMRDATIEQTLAETHTIDFRQVVDPRPARRAVFVAFGAVAAGLMAFWAHPDLGSLALKRLFMPLASNPWPQSTHLEILQAAKKVAKGEPFVLEVGVGKGESAPGSAKVTYFYEGGEKTTEFLRPDDRNKFHGRKEAVDKSFEFQVDAGDDSIGRFQVVAVDPPVVTESSVRLNLPAYTGEAPQRLSPGKTQIRAVRGTVVELEAVANKPIRTARLIRGEGLPPLNVMTDARGTRLSAKFELKDSGTLVFDLTDTEGFHSQEKDALRFDLRAIKDEAPRVVIEEPANDRDVTANADVPIRIAGRRRLRARPRADGLQHGHRRLGALARDDHPAVGRRREEVGRGRETQGNPAPLESRAVEARTRIGPDVPRRCPRPRQPVRAEPRQEPRASPAGRHARRHEAAGGRATAGDPRGAGTRPRHGETGHHPRQGRHPHPRPDRRPRPQGPRRAAQRRDHPEPGEQPDHRQGRRHRAEDEAIPRRPRQSQARRPRRPEADGGTPPRDRADPRHEPRPRRAEPRPRQQGDGRRKSRQSRTRKSNADQEKANAERTSAGDQSKDASKSGASGKDQAGKSAESKKGQNPDAAKGEMARAGESKSGQEKGQSGEAKSGQEKGQSGESKSGQEKAQSGESKSGQEKGQAGDSKSGQEKGQSGQSKSGQSKGQSGESKSGQSKSGQSKSGQEQGQSGEEKGQSGESKSGESKSGESKSGEASKGQPKASEKGQRQSPSPSKSAPRAALAEASKNQQQVADELKKMLDKLGDFEDIQAMIQDSKKLSKAQDDAMRAAAEEGAKPELNGKKAEALTPQEKAALANAADRQAQVAKELAELQNKMDQVADRVEKKDQRAADTLREAAAESRKRNTANTMEEAAQGIEKNQMGQAQAGQKKAQQDLKKLVESLQNRRETELARLLKDLKDANKDIKDLKKREQQNRDATAKAKEMQDPKERAEQLQKLSKEQQQIQQALKKDLLKLQKLSAEQAAQAASKAAQKMAQAGEQMDQDEAEEAMKQQEEALAGLEEVQDEIEQKIQEAEEQLAMEQLSKIKDNLLGLSERQDKVVEETVVYEKKRTEKALTLPQKASVRTLGRTQDALKDEAAELVEKLEFAPAYVLSLKRAVVAMDVASKRLHTLKTDDETQKVETTASKKLKQLLDALKPDQAPPGAAQPQQPPPGGGDQPPGQQRPRGQWRRDLAGRAVEGPQAHAAGDQRPHRGNRRDPPPQEGPRPRSTGRAGTPRRRPAEHRRYRA